MRLFNCFLPCLSVIILAAGLTGCSSKSDDDDSKPTVDKVVLLEFFTNNADTINCPAAKTAIQNKYDSRRDFFPMSWNFSELAGAFDAQDRYGLSATPIAMIDGSSQQLSGGTGIPDGLDFVLDIQNALRPPVSIDAARTYSMGTTINVAGFVRNESRDTLANLTVRFYAVEIQRSDQAINTVRLVMPVDLIPSLGSKIRDYFDISGTALESYTIVIAVFDSSEVVLNAAVLP